MKNKNTSVHEPLFHVVKRDTLPIWKSMLIRVVAVAAALLLCSVLSMVLINADPVEFIETLIDATFGSSRRIWKFSKDAAVLLCIALAITPAFKMRFWNIGAEGQVLIGGLATISVMMFLGDTLPYPVLIIVMLLASVLAGIIWAVIPAFFKAMWNTNETLFTLMMNYVAIQLIAFFLKYFVKSGSGILAPMPEYGLPVIGEYSYLLNVIIVAVLTILVYIYLKKTKHGYEIAVVGESENTAKYIGINVKKVIIRTLILSGALCGIAGLILVGGTNHTISTTTAGGRGFTAIMVSWLAKFNPIYMVLTSFLIVFLEKGASQVSTDFRLPLAISDIVTGIILFFIIGCEFFLQYKILVSKSGKEND